MIRHLARIKREQLPLLQACLLCSVHDGELLFFNIFFRMFKIFSYETNLYPRYLPSSQLKSAGCTKSKKMKYLSFSYLFLYSFAIFNTHYKLLLFFGKNIFIILLFEINFLIVAENLVLSAGYPAGSTFGLRVLIDNPVVSLF